MKKKKFLLLIQHPITTEVLRSENQIVKTLKAIRKSSIQTLIILPNNDSGYLNIVKKIKKSEFRWTKTLTLSEYKTLLKNCSVLVGNSSSGIHEASTFKIPVVNIGSRQNKRLKPKNVVNVAHDEKQIFKAIKLVLKKSFKAKISKIKNPYGNGRSAKKIVNLLKNIDLNRNTQKTINY